jgi:replication factor A1
LREKRRSVGEYLALLSVKFDIDPQELFSGLRQTGVGLKSDRGKFSIEDRGRIDEKKIFLVRTESGMFAQLRVADEFLKSEGDIERFMDTPIVRSLLLKKKKMTGRCLIRDVRSGMTRINLSAKVLSVGETIHVMTRYGNYADVAKARIGDETGAINLLLWNEQIENVSVGSMIHVGGARADVFKGERQLSVGPKGILSSDLDSRKSDGLPCLPLTVKT